MLNVLAVGSGKDVILANYSIHGNHLASWYATRRLPPPPGFPQFRATELPESTAQSIHFLQRQDSLIVSYLHHGVMLDFIRWLSCDDKLTLLIDAGIGILCPLYGKSHRGHVKCSSLSYLCFAPSSFPSGRSCLLADQGVIAATNLLDGVDWYSLASQDRVESLRMTIMENIITPITSDNAGSLIIGGSCGTVQVLHPFSATVAQTLELECKCHEKSS